LIVLAETRKKDALAQEKIRTAINTIVTDLVGGPPDKVVLAPPNTVLKTSSGKIRRNASRDIYERGRIGKPQQAVWLQLVRFTLKGLQPRLRSRVRQATAGLYAAWCWLLYCLLAPVVALLVLVLPAEKLRWAAMRGGIRILAGLSNTKITLHGLANLPDAATPCIFAANHTSYLDSYVISAVLKRPFSFVAKAELKGKTVLRILLKRIGTLFVERIDQQKGVADARRLTAEGWAGRSLFFFPEGTFMRMPGLLPFKMGAFETAARVGLPLVPMVIRGSRSILRPGSWFPRHGSISVTIGTPIYPEKSPAGHEQDTWAAALHLRDKTRQWILTSCGEPDLGHERPRLQASGTTL
jgi:1-acyl-sn-glycerol-3-phosphate acyltransferase